MFTQSTPRNFRELSEISGIWADREALSSQIPQKAYPVSGTSLINLNRFDNNKPYFLSTHNQKCTNKMELIW